MRWSVVVSVCVVAAVMVVNGVAASRRTSLVDQGYEDVVVGISPTLDESQGLQLIKQLKATMNDASKALFKATGNKLFFKKVKILIPKTWKTIPVDEAALTEAYEESDVRVDVGGEVYGDQVYTVQSGGCGVPGLYIYITPKYLFNEQMAHDIWGPRGKVMAQAWARLRWGVFDEIGYPGDNRVPLFYIDYDRHQNQVALPNYCADLKIEGRNADVRTHASCKYHGIMPDEFCRFMPNNNQEAVSSLMSFTDVDSIEDFCEDTDDRTGRHNSHAPTRQNLMCNSRSVWSIISDHQDFLNVMKLPADHPVTPQVLVVQQQGTTFTLVLDYSGSMKGTKLSILVSTAKRWLLHDVADNSSVAIIKFSTGASLLKPLTKISNSTRLELANAITNREDGSTCIGCGLRLAIQQMEGKSNKVIILITDGEENQNPNIAHVMNEVVKSGARVVTISYGNAAEVTLETLAQNTGGKAYVVPDNDDGSFMNNAFQGSLTYQPAESITNTDIKIHEWDGVVRGPPNGEGTFTVDATLGRNLEFRLDTSTFITGDPYLTSPSGTTYTTTHFDNVLNLWIIKLKDVVAESGTWTWTKPLQGSTTIKVTVTSQARNAHVIPIVTRSWMSTGTDFVDASKQRVIVYASVMQGENPVMGARVRAYVTPPDPSAPSVELDLLDNGQNADVQGGDGIYSRYFTQFLTTGRYAVKAQVWDDGNSFTSNGFIGSRRRRRRSVTERLPHPRINSSEGGLVAYEYCCGSFVPIDPETVVATGNFTRTASAGSFNVREMPAKGDSFPPSQVRDLSIDVNTTLSTLVLRWTAPGDDYDTGTVSGYEIWMSINASALIDNLNLNATINLLDLGTSANMTELFQEGGNEVTIELPLPKILKKNILYYFSLRAVDAAGNKSPMSLPLTVSISAGSGSLSMSGGLNPWTIPLLTLGYLRAVF